MRVWDIYGRLCSAVEVTYPETFSFSSAGSNVRFVAGVLQIKDETDSLWRAIRSTSVIGTPTLTLDDTATS